MGPYEKIMAAAGHPLETSAVNPDGTFNAGNLAERIGDWFSGRDRASEYNKYLDETKYQRLVQDLKKAGLNPWLALNGGSLGSASYNSAAAIDNKNTGANGVNSASKLLMAFALVLKLLK